MAKKRIGTLPPHELQKILDQTNRAYDWQLPDDITDLYKEQVINSFLRLNIYELIQERKRLIQRIQNWKQDCLEARRSRDKWKRLAARAMKKGCRAPECLKSYEKHLIPVSISELMPPCIYFLIERNELVYIGQSIDVIARLRQHQNDKKFSAVYVLPVAAEDLDAVEAALIRRHRPPLNSTLRRENPEDELNAMRRYRLFQESGDRQS